jgi:hypothetical protein
MTGGSNPLHLQLQSDGSEFFVAWHDSFFECIYENCGKIIVGCYCEVSSEVVRLKNL